jgi:hypothetical protein
MDLEVEDLDSTTFGRQELDCDFEASSCFYVQNVERVLGKDRIDLAVDPPPYLVVEVETSPPMDKLPMFAGVPSSGSVGVRWFMLVDSPTRARQLPGSGNK